MPVMPLLLDTEGPPLSPLAPQPLSLENASWRSIPGGVGPPRLLHLGALCYYSIDMPSPYLELCDARKSSSMPAFFIPQSVASPPLKV